MQDDRTTGVHEESTLAILAQRAAEGVEVPPELASLLVESARWLDVVPTDRDPGHAYATVKIAQVLLSTEKRIGALPTPEQRREVLDERVGRSLD